jgi:hypothetical protein
MPPSVIATKTPAAVLERAKREGIALDKLGQSGGAEIKLSGVGGVVVDTFKKAHETWLPNYMN